MEVAGLRKATVPNCLTNVQVHLRIDALMVCVLATQITVSNQMDVQ